MRETPRFADVADPTADELRAWARSGAPEPMQDWDVVIAESGNALLLVELVADPRCTARAYLLGSLYCLVGHGRWDDPRVVQAVDAAGASTDPWLLTWARRVAHVTLHPEDFRRTDWCGLDGLRTRSDG